MNRALISSSTVDANPSNDVDTARVTTGLWQIPLTGAHIAPWMWVAGSLVAIGAAFTRAARRPASLALGQRPQPR